jgi:hypothetical protein
MNSSNLIKLMSDLYRWSKTRNGKIAIMTVSMLAMTVPPVVKTLDSWISSASYAQAVKKVKEIERTDARLVKKIYLDYYNEMSSGVRLAFQEFLKHKGESI